MYKCFCLLCSEHHCTLYIRNDDLFSQLLKLYPIQVNRYTGVSLKAPSMRHPQLLKCLNENVSCSVQGHLPNAIYVNVNLAASNMQVVSCKTYSVEQETMKTGWISFKFYL